MDIVLNSSGELIVSFVGSILLRHKTFSPTCSIIICDNIELHLLRIFQFQNKIY